MNAPVKLTTGKPPEVLAFKLPDEERRAEQVVADMFVRQYRKGGGCGDLNVNEIYNFCISDLRQNPQDDLDFTLTTDRGERYLELMVIAPLGHGG